MELEMIKKIQVDELRMYLEIVGSVHGIDAGELTFGQYAKKLEAMSFLNNMPTSNKILNKIEINGEKFKRPTNVNDIKGGQFIDFAVVRERDNMAEILATLYQKDGWAFKQRLEWIKKYETMDSAFPYLSFFLDYLKRLSKVIHKYLNSQTNPMSAAQTYNRGASTVGS